MEDLMRIRAFLSAPRREVDTLLTSAHTIKRDVHHESDLRFPMPRGKMPHIPTETAQLDFPDVPLDDVATVCGHLVEGGWAITFPK
jgi:hypothetical protein